ncbi:MAG: peptidylprolyl isomerase [Epulopiscium sp.]|nr:peptidylprolyl isomerase [Candidatus Epulonipiscium sp.]
MENKVLAVVDGREITELDLQTLMQSLGQNAMQFQGEEGKAHLLNEIVAQELLYSEAAENKLDEEDDFKAALGEMEKSLLIQYAASKLMKSVTVDEAEVKAFFDNNKDMFKQEASAVASHILVDDKETADKVLAEIKDGLSFADAAKKYSTCPSKEQGGSLGEFTRGRMVPEFEDAAFSMKAGEISEPVQTQFGYHIIELDSINDPEEVLFDDVKDQVKQQCLVDKQGKVYMAKQDELKGKYSVEIK